ncbi:MAG: PfkB family carbohydrate kinase, partial [Candidatus Oleimicrobiaceae bacterium]
PLADDELLTVAEASQEMICEPETSIFAQGGWDERVYILQEGKVATHASLRPGSRCGGEAAAGVITGAKALLVQLETPLETVQCAMRLAVERGVPAILNPAPSRQLPPELLRLAHIITPNEHEAELLTGVRLENERALHQVAARLHEAGVANVIITLGAKGAFVSEGKMARLVTGWQAKAVDTTAAGDAFNGALAVGLGRALDLVRAVRYANAAAALAVQKLGAQPSLPTAEEVEHFLACARVRST